MKAIAAILALAAFAGSPQERPAVVTWLRMVDATRGYALGGRNSERYELLRTSDGGRHWVDITPAAHPSGPVTVAGRTILFSTSLGPRTFAVERSDDGGRTWHRSVPFRDRRGGIGQPFSIDGRHLYVAIGEGAAAGSEAEALFSSGNGGQRWHFVARASYADQSPESLPFGCDKNGFGFATPLRGWAGGYCPGGPPFFYRTGDGGRTWKRQQFAGLTKCACDTSAPRFFGTRNGVFSVAGFRQNGDGTPFARIYWTRDGGRRWRASDPHAGRAQRPSFAGPRTAWFAATPPGRIRSPFNRLFRTTDAGHSWHVLALPFDGQNFVLDAVSGTLAYAYRFDGVGPILRTDDGGRTWSKVRPVVSG